MPLFQSTKYATRFRINGQHCKSMIFPPFFFFFFLKEFYYLKKKKQLWDVETGQELHALLGHTAEIVSLNFNSTGDKIITGYVLLLFFI